MGRKKFMDWIAKSSMPKPPNFEKIKRINLGLAATSIEDIRELEAGPNRCAVV